MSETQQVTTTHDESPWKTAVRAVDTSAETGERVIISHAWDDTGELYEYLSSLEETEHVDRDALVFRGTDAEGRVWAVQMKRDGRLSMSGEEMPAWLLREEEGRQARVAAR